MTEVSVLRADPYVQRLRDARASPAVLKARLVTFRSSRPGVLVFAFEGGDDKIIYYQWIRRLRPGLQYEPFPCDGKRDLRKLKNLAYRDVNGIENGLYYFVDRDFDDLTGFDDEDHVFMTDRYSVENYLVDKVVLEETLKNEFPCHAEPLVRDRILSTFAQDYQRFLELTRVLNLRVFLSRRVPVHTIDRIPEKLSSMVDLNALGDVRPSATPPDQVVRFAAEPDVQTAALLEAEFDQLQAAARYRGKFSYKFFITWLLMLSEELRNRTTSLFSGIDPQATARISELVLGSFAAKSDLPARLNEFLDAVTL